MIFRRNRQGVPIALIIQICRGSAWKAFVWLRRNQSRASERFVDSRCIIIFQFNQKHALHVQKWSATYRKRWSMLVFIKYTLKVAVDWYSTFWWPILVAKCILSGRMYTCLSSFQWRFTNVDLTLDPVRLAITINGNCKMFLMTLDRS